MSTTLKPDQLLVDGTRPIQMELSVVGSHQIVITGMQHEQAALIIPQLGLMVQTRRDCSRQFAFTDAQLLGAHPHLQPL